MEGQLAGVVLPLGAQTPQVPAPPRASRTPCQVPFCYLPKGPHIWAQELYLFRSPGAWKEVPIVIAMQGDVEHGGVIVERLLGAIAMVNVLVGGVKASGKGPGLPKVKIPLVTPPLRKW